MTSSVLKLERQVRGDPHAKRVLPLRTRATINPVRTYLSAALAIALAGCAGPARPALAPVHGSFVEAGKPLTLGPKDRPMVVFYPTAMDLPIGLSYLANFRPDGSFDVLGSQGQGIPIGPYRVK